MLAGSEGVPRDVTGYQLEPKLDGQRVVAVVEAGALTLLNRRGGDITPTYPELAGLVAGLDGHEAVLDGEVVTFDADGRTSFQRLQRRMHVARPTARLLEDVPAVYAAFDVLWLDGEELAGQRQDRRRRELEALALRGPAWQTVPTLDATPDELLAACRDLGLEGFMAKRRDSVYQPGRRSPAWVKVKCGRRREFVVGGWAAGQGSRRTGIGSLALGSYDVAAEQAEAEGRRPRLFYVGQAGSGLTDDWLGQLRDLFARIEVAAAPFENPPAVRDLHWVQPLLVVEVAYSEVTESGTLRQPSIKGLRTDKVAGDVAFDHELAARFGTSG